MRTVKSCVGSTWCRYGVQDSTALAIRIEERYRGIRAPHKLKSAVSGCIRECAEAQSKDFGVIATEQGWNLYVGGNGGAQPRHADLLAADVDEETLIRLIDRFLMYYIHTANPLERTARWLERLDGGLEHLKRVVVDDALGIGAQLERDMQQLVDRYALRVGRGGARSANAGPRSATSPTRRAADPAPAFVRERGQRRPADWPTRAAAARHRRCRATRRGCGGRARRRRARATAASRCAHGDVQIAVFHFATPRRVVRHPGDVPAPQDMVLGRGLLGTQGGEPKVACPLHKKTFSLATGDGLSDPQLPRRRPSRSRCADGDVWVRAAAGARRRWRRRRCRGGAERRHRAMRTRAEGASVRRRAARPGDGTPRRATALLARQRGRGARLVGSGGVATSTTRSSATSAPRSSRVVRRRRGAPAPSGAGRRRHSTRARC